MNDRLKRRQGDGRPRRLRRRGRAVDCGPRVLEDVPEGRPSKRAAKELRGSERSLRDAQQRANLWVHGGTRTRRSARGRRREGDRKRDGEAR
jgi:hypothetical protein